MERLIDTLTGSVLKKHWGEYEFRGKTYLGMTFGSYQYRYLIEDFNTFTYLKMMMKNYFIQDYEIVERYSDKNSGISIYIEKEQYGKLEYFLKNASTIKFTKRSTV
jgi:hypothetical protein